MYRIEIDGLCGRGKAPRFSSFEDAKSCYDSAVDFVYRFHSDESIEVWLLNDDEDTPVLWTIVEGRK